MEHTHKVFYIAKNKLKNNKVIYLNDFGTDYKDCCHFSEFPLLGWEDRDEAIEYFSIVASNLSNVILVSKNEHIYEKLADYDSNVGLRSYEDIATILSTSKQNVSQTVKKVMGKLYSRLKRNNPNYSCYEIVYGLMQYFNIRTEKETEDFISSFPTYLQEKIAIAVQQEIQEAQ